MDWLTEHWQLIAYALAGIGVIGIAVFRMMATKPNSGTPIISITNSNVQSGSSPAPLTANETNHRPTKDSAKILFIDDDTSFQVVKILRKAGWLNVKIVKDLNSLDSQEVRDTDLFFVDIQGVGKALDFKAEGLGLAAAIKRKYPRKKVVIYSAEQQGDRFHEGLRLADATLRKTAEPYEFQRIVEQQILGE